MLFDGLWCWCKKPIARASGGREAARPMTVPGKGGPRSEPLPGLLPSGAMGGAGGLGLRLAAALQRREKHADLRLERAVQPSCLATGYGPGFFWWHGVPHGTQFAPTRAPTVSTAGPGGLPAFSWHSALLNLWPGSWLCLARATPAKAREASFCSKSGPGSAPVLRVRCWLWLCLVIGRPANTGATCLADDLTLPLCVPLRH